ncbi:hypothetical protein LWI29_011814 [Acer saccharum]|uniref:Glycosyltransferase N-terminal domain-containing protein n=1 Tax=Acer saccharum TaxID=4024 RepID=A0AA39T645_ACESA|nr:hypothetical protein LWI29_011814 [Acer saccharum]
MAETKENIVMFPFMAQGHIIPFLALAFQLEKTNKYTITFVNTKKNINKLRSSLPPNSSFNLVEIPFDSSDHNLPPDTENTDSIPYNLVPILIEATLSFKPHFRKLVSGLVSEQNGQKKPLCIITGIFFGWCAEIAHEFGVFHALFIAGGGFGFACYYSMWMNLPHKNTDSDEFLLPDFPEASRIHVTQLTDYLRVADGSDSFSVSMQKLLTLWRNVDGILVNTVEELDQIGLMYFRREICPQVWPIGPLLLSTGSKDRAGKQLGISSQVCKNWLDTKPCSSVLTWMLIVVSDKIWRRKSNFKPHLPIGNPRDKNVVAQGLPWWKNVTRKDSAGVNDMVGYGLGNKDEDYNKDYEYSYGNNGENGVVPIKEGFVFISQRNDMGPCVEIGLRPVLDPIN